MENDEVMGARQGATNFSGANETIFTRTGGNGVGPTSFVTGLLGSKKTVTQQKTGDEEEEDKRIFMGGIPFTMTEAEVKEMC